MFRRGTAPITYLRAGGFDLLQPAPGALLPGQAEVIERVRGVAAEPAVAVAAAAAATARHGVVVSGRGSIAVAALGGRDAEAAGAGADLVPPGRVGHCTGGQ